MRAPRAHISFCSAELHSAVAQNCILLRFQSSNDAGTIAALPIANRRYAECNFALRTGRQNNAKIRLAIAAVSGIFCGLL